MTGVSSDRTVDGRRWRLPTGVLAVGDDQISVSITLRPVTATRTFSAGRPVHWCGAQGCPTTSTSTGSW